MKKNLRNMLMVAGVGLGAGMLAPGCVIRAQVRPAYVVDQAPPAPRYETPRPRAGYVWVRGHHEWRGNRWVWKRGTWKRARAGYRWDAGRWEQRGNRWHWVQGRWVTGATVQPRTRDHRVNRPAPRPPVVRQPAPRPVPAFPTVAPPAPRYQIPAPRTGFVWVKGHYNWVNGAYVWQAGHWQAAQASKIWVAGQWTLQNGRYTWTPGHWEPAPVPVRTRDHRTNGGNGRRNERVPARRGVPR